MNQPQAADQFCASEPPWKKRLRLRALGSACLIALATACQPDRITMPDRVRVAPDNASMVVVVPNAASQDAFIRGIHYFAGWRTPDPDFADPNLTNSDRPDEYPWDDIQVFNSSNWPPRLPRLGYYNDGLQSVSDAQILAMVDAGFDYVIYQVNWSHKKWVNTGAGITRGHTITNHNASPNAGRLKFSVMWDDANSSMDTTNIMQESGAAYNHWFYELRQNGSQWTAQTVIDDFTALYTVWFRDYASGPHFHKYNGRPVVFFFGPQTLRVPKLVLGGGTPDAASLIALLRSVAAQYGFSGATTPYVVGQNVPPAYMDSLPGWGFDAHSGYTHRTGPTSDPTTGANFPAADALYRSKWSEAVSVGPATFQFWVPNAHGVDGRPWNEGYHWTATPAQFKSLVQASMDFAATYASKTGRNLVTCCWNEWGEGPSMEPWTLESGYAYKGSQLSDAHRHTVVGGGNQVADGNFDNIEPNGYAWGWAVDPDTPNSEITVHFYADAAHGQPGAIWIGGSTTYVMRADINAMLGVGGTHGFEYDLSGWCGKPIFVHLIDSSGNDVNPVLHNSGRSFAC